MLTFLGFAMVITFMYLIMTKRLSALIALILVPILFALFGGFSAKIGPMMLEGISKLAPTGVMLMFAILYFALMIDSGLFDPAVRKILKDLGGTGTSTRFAAAFRRRAARRLHRHRQLLLEHPFRALHGGRRRRSGDTHYDRRHHPTARAGSSLLKYHDYRTSKF